MRVTLEITNLKEIETLYSFFKTTKIDSFEIVTENLISNPNIQKGNKNLNPRDLFGIWKNNPMNIGDIRTISWDRKN